MRVEKTFVRVFGFDNDAPHWQSVVWGEPPDRLGRIPKAIECALRYPADTIYIGPGKRALEKASEADLVEWMSERQELKQFSCFAELSDGDWQRLSDIVAKRCQMDHPLPNTEAEAKHIVEICAQQGVTRLVLVSSPDHAPRCLTKVLQVTEAQGLTTRLDVSAEHSHVSYSDQGVAGIYGEECREVTA